MTVECIAVLLLALLGTGGTANVSLTVTNRTLPDPLLMMVTTLVCEIDITFNDTGASIESRWLLPSGQELLKGDAMDMKHLVNQGPNGPSFESVLLIQKLTYSDAGTFICRVRDIRDPSNRGPWVEASLTLELLVDLTAGETDITVFDNVTEVSLSCEMSLYLRPDQDLQWSRDGVIISDGSARYSISYEDGTFGRGQFGQDTFGSSRLSILVISQPQSSDSGNYICSIRNTPHTQNIQLAVDQGSLSNPPTVQPTSTRSNAGDSTTTSMTSSSPPSGTMSPVNGNSLPLPIIIGAIAGVLGIVVVVLIIIIIIILSCWARSHITTIAKYHQETDVVHEKLSSNQVVICDTKLAYEMVNCTVEPEYEEISEAEHVSSNDPLALEVNPAYGEGGAAGSTNEVILEEGAMSTQSSLNLDVNPAYSCRGGGGRIGGGGRGGQEGEGGGVAAGLTNNELSEEGTQGPTAITTDTNPAYDTAPHTHSDQALVLEQNIAYGNVEVQENSASETLTEVVYYI